MSARNKRFDGKKDRIIICATAIMNERGVRGMTLAEVAAAAGMVPTSIAYYFGKKEALAAACFTVGIERLEQLLAAASVGASARERLTLLLEGYFRLKLNIAKGEEAPIPVFSDIRTLGDPWFTDVVGRWRAFFQHTRDLLRTPELKWLRGRAAAARTNLIVEQMLWLDVWLWRHDFEEYPRLCARMLDILLDGLAPTGALWAPQTIELEAVASENPMPDALLIAATRLVNQHGYKGASVDKISAALQRTKGAFYHHIDGKDELVVAGFNRTFDILRAAQTKAMALDGEVWTKLNSTVVALTDFQMSEVGPLMRSSALQSLPETVRRSVLQRSDRIALRFAGMIADGEADGTLRSVDPMIAAQMLTASINAVADRWLAKVNPELERGPLHYAVPALFGILCGPVSQVALGRAAPAEVEAV